MLPLQGYTVLDLTLRAPGPYCTWILGDLGADVLRVEEPHSRAREDARDPAEEEQRAAHDVLGRNKRSIALNLKNGEARDIFHRLCEGADAVVEGFRPGVVQRLGVDYETLRSINPRIIYCSLSGFGQTGPYRSLPGHDINYIALGGALGITGHPGGPPAIPGNLLADFAGGGMQAAIGVLVALLHRERTGEGQQIDVAMSDGVVALMATAFSEYFATGEAPLPGETRLTGAVPYYQSYLTKDGRYLSVGCLEPWFFENLCRLLESADFLPHQHEPGGLRLLQEGRRRRVCRGRTAGVAGRRPAHQHQRREPGGSVPPRVRVDQRGGAPGPRHVHLPGGRSRDLPRRQRTGRGARQFADPEEVANAGPVLPRGHAVAGAPAGRRRCPILGGVPLARAHRAALFRLWRVPPPARGDLPPLPVVQFSLGARERPGRCLQPHERRVSQPPRAERPCPGQRRSGGACRCVRCANGGQPGGLPLP
ncbi:MAG: CoA transferase [Dehalococcoidia bacterium]|nr:CoA transferase [Dehalococcoidia bacterium]